MKRNDAASRIRARNAAGYSPYSGSISVVINFCRTYSMDRGGGEWSWGSFGIGAELMSSGYAVNILSISNGGEIVNHGLTDTNGNGYLDSFSFEEKNMEWRVECNKGLCWYWKYPEPFNVQFNVTGIEASIPSAPANLAASLSCPNVNLSWQDTSANETSFRVERAPAGSGAFGTLATLGANATSYQDANLADGNYDYRVFANNSFGDSASSNTANIAVACNQPPQAIPNAVGSAYFCSAPLRPLLSWAFQDPNPGDTQSAYQVQVDNNSDFSSPAADSGKIGSSQNFYSVPSGALNYGTTYYWRVQVWDSKDAASGWTNGPQFTTQPHLCPAVDFRWLPSKPSAGEKVKFTESVTFYGGAALASRNWSIPDAERYAPPQGKIKTIFSKIFGWLIKNIFAISTGDQNPEIIFQTSGSKSVQLQITDSDGLINSATKTINVNIALPKWKEIK
ncbi:MAG: fibronectin type III domain-containing protein [Patescibacteria group bacterium]